jgi:hypothetical protein
VLLRVPAPLTPPDPIYRPAGRLAAYLLGRQQYTDARPERDRPRFTADRRRTAWGGNADEERANERTACETWNERRRRRACVRD